MRPNHVCQFSVYGGHCILDGPVDFSLHRSAQYLEHPLRWMQLRCCWGSLNEG